MSADASPRPASLLDTAQDMGATVLRALHTRVELVAVDLERERDALLRRLTLLLVALFSGTFGPLLAVAWIVMSVAESVRTQVLGVLALVFIGLGVLCYFLIRSDIVAGGGFMAATLGVLGDDAKALAGGASRATTEAEDDGAPR